MLSSTLIDESHKLPTAFLEEIRFFTNFDCDRRDKIVLILAGQPQLVNHLRLAINEPLSQRIIVRASLSPLTPDEVTDYVQHRLHSVGRSAPIFTHCAFEALYRASRGVPRLIDQLAERSLVEACKAKSNEIDSNLITSIAIETEF